MYVKRSLVSRGGNEMSIINLIRELDHDLRVETGADPPILSIKVSHEVWHAIAAEICGSKMLWVKTDSFVTATSLELIGIEITR